VPEAISKLLETILASTKTHKWWWAGGGGATLVAVAALVVVYGGFFGPSGRAICTPMLEQARAYGVVPQNASLADSEAKKDEKVSGRRLCTAQAGDDKYVLSVDLSCNDLKKPACLSLFAVERGDGLSTYQKRKEETDDGMASMAPPPPEQTAPDNQTAPSPDAMPSSSDTPQAPPPDGGQSGFGDAPPASSGNADQSGQQTPPQQ
jgi:hypothetical protein